MLGAGNPAGVCATGLMSCCSSGLVSGAVRGPLTSGGGQLATTLSRRRRRLNETMRLRPTQSGSFARCRVRKHIHTRANVCISARQRAAA